MPDKACMFAGVNEGYEGSQFTITDSVEAVGIVKHALQAITEKTQDDSRYKLFPGLAVYNCDRGCPKSGEVVAAVIGEGKIGAILQTARELRKQLKQSTLFVGIEAEGFASKTRGLSLTVARSMRDFGEVWQVKAAEYNNANNMYVPCAMYEDGSGAIVVRSEANPGRFKDIARWEDAAQAVAIAAGAELGLILHPKFRDVEFGYFSIGHP